MEEPYLYSVIFLDTRYESALIEKKTTSFDVRQTVKPAMKNVNDAFNMSKIPMEQNQTVRLKKSAFYFSGNVDKVQETIKQHESGPGSTITELLNNCTRRVIAIHRKNELPVFSYDKDKSTRRDDVNSLLSVCERFLATGDDILEAAMCAEKLMLATRNSANWADIEGIEYVKDFVKICANRAEGMK